VSAVEALSIRTELSLEDWRAFRYEYARRLRASAPHLQRLAFVATIAAMTIAGLWILDVVELRAQPASLAFGALLVLVPIIVNYRLAVRSTAPETGGAFFGPQVIELGAQGLKTRKGYSTSEAAWPAIRDVSASELHVWLWIDRSQAYLIPLRDLPAGVGRDDLLARVESWRAAAHAEPGALARHEGDAVPGPAAATAAPGTSGAARTPSDGAGAAGVRPWLATIARLLALTGRASPARFGAGSVVALAAASLATWFVLDWLNNRPDATLFIYGLPGIAWHALAVLALAWVIARCCSPWLGYTNALALVLLPLPLLILLDHASVHVGRFVLVFGTASVFLYFFAYLAQGVLALGGRSQTRAALAGSVVAIGLCFATSRLYVDSSIWMPGDVDSYESAWDDAEGLLFSQPERIDHAVAAVRPGDDASTDFFFVGFAGYAEQRVFAEEIGLAADVVAERYAAADRRLLLVNDRRDLQSTPLATKTGLEYALRELASRMNIEQDVLFLSLSSHGSSDWAISVVNGGLPLADVTSTDLAAMLASSGIKWRVIVISACYAGGFIDALRSPTTIILAAAALDRTSFGCSDERDLTYFGEAFYRDALPGASSLRAAFEDAQRAIAERETREGFELASNPIGDFGSELERKLDELEAPR
jgi:hypothetical protein